MQSAKMKPLSPILERHTPQHPLPDEIKEMSRDTTVCQFCGVSYLIHHEIKMLEEKVNKLEEELERNHGATEREQRLRDELEKNKAALSILNHAIHEKENVVENITKEIERHQKINEDLQSQLREKQQEISLAAAELKSYQQNTVEKLGKLHQACKLMKFDLVALHKTVGPALSQFAGDIQSTALTVHNEITHFCEGFQRSNDDQSLLKSQIHCLEMELCASNEATKAVEKDKNSQIDQLKNWKEEAECQVKLLKTKVAELENACSEYANTSKKTEMQCKVYQSETAQMEDKLKKKQSEVQSIAAKLHTTEDMADATIQRLNRDCKQLERELATSHEESRKLKRAMEERDKKTDEMNRTASLHSGQLQQISNDLEETKANLKAMVQEREQMVLSHQNQIEQLRESFKKKLKASDFDPNKAQQNLQALEERHRVALVELEQRLKSDFKIELSVERDKHAEAMHDVENKHKRKLREVDASLQEKVQSYKHQLPVLNQKIEMLSKSMDEKTTSFEEEKASLKMLISQLEEKIAGLLREQDNNVALSKLETSVLQKKADEALHQNQLLETQIESMKEEINLLQDTVRRECEERFELTDALCQAREQMKVDKVSSSTTATSLSPFKAPVSAVNALDPSPIENELGQLSGQTLKSLGSTDSAALTPRHNLPSLRSLPDIPSRKELSQNGNPVKHATSAARLTSSVSTHVRDISFGCDEDLRRSHSTGANEQKLHNGSTTASRSGNLYQSRSADTVDTARRRIAAAIKRK